VVLTQEEKYFLATHSPIFSCYIFFRNEYEPAIILKAIEILVQDFPSCGLVIIGSQEGAEPYMDNVSFAMRTGHVFLAGEKSHDNFLSLIKYSHLVIRTPIGDGVSSSVMEALAIGVPVVASDNGTRPAGVVLFKPSDPVDLAQKVKETMNNLAQIKQKLSGLYDRDAIREEYDLLKKISYH
jgi:glycosyltransferase involved in cell wall biosynthesis